MAIANIGSILASSLQIGGNAIENAVAKAWLVKHVNDYDRVELAVGLGPGIKLWPGAPAYVVKSAAEGGQMRADMIAWSGTVPTVVEFKARIYSSALGQVLTYAHWLQVDNPQLLQVYKIVAGQNIQDGISQLFDRYGIIVELFPAAVPPSQ